MQRSSSCPKSSLLGSRVGPTGLRQLDRVLRKARIARRYEVNRVYSYETLVRNALAKTELRLRAVPLCDPVVGQQCPSQLGCRDHGRLVPRTLPRMARRDCPPGALPIPPIAGSCSSTHGTNGPKGTTSSLASAGVAPTWKRPGRPSWPARDRSVDACWSRGSPQTASLGQPGRTGTECFWLDAD